MMTIPKSIRSIALPLAAAVLIASMPGLGADPQLSSWLEGISGNYARIYSSTTNRTNGVSETTWSGNQSQTLPAYAGVNEIDYSANWVYFRTTGLAGFIMGPWSNPNLATNQAILWRIPRTPNVSTGTYTLTSLGEIGYLVDGVAIYNTSDGFSYLNAHSEDASPTVTNFGNGDGIWNRDAFVNEAVSFDYALSHPQQNGEYHSHVNPIATRYELGDNIVYNSTTKNYSENLTTTTFQHSPILGWMKDGLPLYGPYGYDGGSTGATAVATVSGGSVTSITMTNSGTLYQSAPLVTFSGGSGSGAAATATVSSGTVSVALTSGGTGYTSAPTVTIGGVRRMVSGYVLRTGSVRHRQSQFHGANHTACLGCIGAKPLNHAYQFPVWPSHQQHLSARSLRGGLRLSRESWLHPGLKDQCKRRLF